MEFNRISNNIRNIGFLMTCFMVMYHTKTLEWHTISAKDAAINQYINNIFESMGTLVMCHFFAVTGFLLFYQMTKRNYPEKLKRRIWSLS